MRKTPNHYTFKYQRGSKKFVKKVFQFCITKYINEYLYILKINNFTSITLYNF